MKPLLPRPATRRKDGTSGNNSNGYFILDANHIKAKTSVNIFVI
jgi:hypothetical protein